MKQQRRSLSNVGGPTDLWGDSAEARKLARCFSVHPPERLPFTHGFHPYPARMHPEIAQRAIEVFAPTGRIVDPFVGSGTVALEAVRAGLSFSGSDISRVALEVAWVRTRVLPPAECRKVEAKGGELARRAAAIPKAPLPAWLGKDERGYAPHTAREIASLLAALADVADPALRRILTCVLSSILVRLSRQVSDSATGIDETARPWPAGAAFQLFGERCSDLTKQLLTLSSDLHKRKVAFLEPDFRQEDARKATWPDPVDLVITSPPYAGTYDYALHHARRLPLFDSTPAEVRAAEIGTRSRLQDQPKGLEEYRNDLAEVMKRIPAKRMIWLIGDGVAAGKEAPADRVLEEAGKAAGFRVVAGASQERVDWSFARRGGRRHEHLVLLHPRGG